MPPSAPLYPAMRHTPFFTPGNERIAPRQVPEGWIIFASVVAALVLSIGLLFPKTVSASSARQKYMEADDCFKRLRHSAVKRQKRLEWLTCIEKYENIYVKHPDSAWAPAGMYKAANLYFTLYELSHDPIYRFRGIDLLFRVKNKYPKSAYTQKAKNRLKKTGEKVPDSPVKHLRAKKTQTRKRSLSKKPEPERKPKTPVKKAVTKKPISHAPPGQSESSPDPGEDPMITDLRFWSNPEYTRIVVNASRERSYNHHLLKKDPNINQPFQRLYVDIEQARLSKNVSEHTPINDNLLKQARAGQYLPHTVRVVVDIKSFENYKIFSLKDPFRIIIDVWGKGSDTPLPRLSQKGGKGRKKPEQTHRISTDNLKSSDITRQLALGVHKIVIDPGHGGQDPGAPGAVKGVWEKDIVLKMAKKLAAKLRDRLKCTVIMTRSTDKKLTLEERTALANTQRADLFISLHCNAAKNKKLAGIETYLLNLATDDQAIAVAARENATSRKNISDLDYILDDLMKHAKIEESTRLAHDVQQAMVGGMKKKYSGVTDLGVKKAPFYVLLGARMPAILIESSFISNQKECKRLLTASYRNDICNAITDGIEKYIDATNPREL